MCTTRQKSQNVIQQISHKSDTSTSLYYEAPYKTASVGKTAKRRSKVSRYFIFFSSPLPCIVPSESYTKYPYARGIRLLNPFLTSHYVVKSCESQALTCQTNKRKIGTCLIKRFVVKIKIKKNPRAGNGPKGMADP